MISILVILSVVALAWLWLLIGSIRQRAFGEVLNASTGVVPDITGRHPLPPVTIIVPARNEADTLPRTLPTVCRQDYPDLRVVLVDDQSEDGSAAVIEKLEAEQSNLAVVHGRPRPDGWYGKQWAIQQGLERATTDWLLFTDADIVFHPQALKQAVSYMLAHDLEMLSLLPRLVFGSTVERLALSGAMAAFVALFPLSRANDPRSKLAVAAGAFILIRREAYQRIGGHEAVKDQMIEDLNLARVLKAAGTRMQTHLTGDLLSTRMYDGWDDLWEGLSKNAYAGINYSPWKFLAGLIGGLLIGVLPPVYLVGSLLAVALMPSLQTWAAVVLSLVIFFSMLAVHGRVVRYFRLPWYYVLLLPVSGVFYSLFVTSSVYQHYFRGGNTWKGRRYVPPTPG